MIKKKYKFFGFIDKVNDFGGYIGKRIVGINGGYDILTCSGGGKQNPSHHFWDKVVFGEGRPMPFIGCLVAAR